MTAKEIESYDAELCDLLTWFASRPAADRAKLLRILEIQNEADDRDV